MQYINYITFLEKQAIFFLLLQRRPISWIRDKEVEIKGHNKSYQWESNLEFLNPRLRVSATVLRGATTIMNKKCVIDTVRIWTIMQGDLIQRKTKCQVKTDKLIHIHGQMNISNSHITEKVTYIPSPMDHGCQWWILLMFTQFLCPQEKLEVSGIV